jgi:enoyl-CoA hydratase
MAYETIEVNIADNNVATLKLNRPRVLNAIDHTMMMELRRAFAELDENPNAHVVVLRGEGRAFCAGADIKWSESLSVSERAESNRLGQKTFDMMERMDTPIFAAVHGYALGGGLELALAADFIVANENAQLGLPEITLSARHPYRPKITEDGDPDQPEAGGQAPGWGSPKRLPTLVGRAMARHLMLTGVRVDAEKALRIGLVVDVFKESEFDDEVSALADRLAAMNPYNTRLIKGLINAGYDMLESHPQ